MACQDPLPIFMRSNLYTKSNKAWRGRSTSVQIETLINSQGPDVRDRSETPVGAHLQIVAQQIQTECLLERGGCHQLFRGRMDFIIALAMANLCKLQRSAEFQAF